MFHDQNLLVLQTLNSRQKNLLVYRNNQEGNQLFYKDTIMLENAFNKAEIFQQSLSDSRQHTTNLPSSVVATSQSTLPSPDAVNLLPMLSHGGVTVGVIIAMTWFSQTLLKSFLDILTVVNQTRK